MSVERTFLGKGRVGKVFREGDEVIKQFQPNHSNRLLYRLFYQAAHPFAPENPLFPLALGAAEQRRHLASRLSRVSSSKLEVLDAQKTNGGLKMPFIDGRPTTPEDEAILKEIDRMAQFLENMGLSSWNVRGPYGWFNWQLIKLTRRAISNVLISKDKAWVVDNEEGGPTPDRKWGVRYGDVDHCELNEGLRAKQAQVLQRIGPEGLSEVKRSAEIEKMYWGAFRHEENSPLVAIQTVVRALKPAQLSETIDWLLKIGRINLAEAEKLRGSLDEAPALKKQFEAVGPHLLVHNIIGLLPPGISSLGRFTYTLGAKAVENLLRKDPKKHTWVVAVASLIPSVGNFAYLIDIIPTENPALTKLALESIAYHGFYTWLDHLIEIWGKRGFSRKSVATMENILKRMAFAKRALAAMLEDQFGKEIVEEMIGKFIAAAKSKPDISDYYPTQIYLGDKIYFVNWGGDKIIILDPIREEAREATREERKKIIDLLRQERISFCQDFERILMAEYK